MRMVAAATKLVFVLSINRVFGNLKSLSRSNRAFDKSVVKILREISGEIVCDRSHLVDSYDDGNIGFFEQLSDWLRVACTNEDQFNWILKKGLFRLFLYFVCIVVYIQEFP